MAEQHLKLPSTNHAITFLYHMIFSTAPRTSSHHHSHAWEHVSQVYGNVVTTHTISKHVVHLPQTLFEKVELSSF